MRLKKGLSPVLGNSHAGFLGESALVIVRSFLTAKLGRLTNLVSK